MAFLSKFPQAKLFPAVWGWSEKQKGMTHCPLVAWSVKSSSDPEQIRKWLEGRPKRYACIALAQSDMSCLDVDNKKGKDGRSLLLRLELENEDLPETMQGATPSDGDHYLFIGTMAQGTNKFGLGLDSAGMVPVPGSNALGKGQYRIVKNGVMAQLPSWLKSMAGEKKTKADREEAPAVDTDLEHNVERAISYLQNAPEAIEGSGGDATAYTVACKVRDFGLSENMAIELMHEHYADRCSPYDADWLESKVVNAYQYAQKPIGSSTAEAAFQDVEAPEQTADTLECPDPQKPLPRFKFLTRDEILAAPPLQWRVKGVIPSRGLAAMSGQSRAGKSFLVFDMACAIAEGRSWFGYRTKPCPIVYVCLEGEAGFKHRVEAWEKQNGRPMPAGITMIKEPFQIVDPTQVAGLAMDAPKNALIIVDTMSRSSAGVDENGPEGMGLIIKGGGDLQRLTDGIVLLVAHEGKDASKGLRGHSSLIAALDGHVVVTKDNDQCIWKIDKAKDGKDGAEHGFELEVLELGLDEDGDKITSCVILPTEKPIRSRPKLTKAEQVGLDAFHAAMDDDYNGVRIDAWTKEFIKKHTGDNENSKRRIFRRIRSVLVEKGYLDVNDDTYYIKNIEDLEISDKDGGGW